MQTLTERKEAGSLTAGDCFKSPLSGIFMLCSDSKKDGEYFIVWLASKSTLRRTPTINQDQKINVSCDRTKILNSVYIGNLSNMFNELRKELKDIP